MDCQNHAGIVAAGSCTGCAEPFCSHCLVFLKGSPYCAACKTMALPPGAMAIAAKPCPQASEALRYAVVSFFCFGVVLGPVAISKALDARKRITEDPTLLGRGRANAAIFLGVAALGLWILGMMQRAFK